MFKFDLLENEKVINIYAKRRRYCLAGADYFRVNIFSLVFF